MKTNMLLFYVKTLSSTYKVFFLLILKEIKPFLWVSESSCALGIVPPVPDGAVGPDAHPAPSAPSHPPRPRLPVPGIC